MGIRLSNAHGVNSSLDLCFFCNEPKGVALLGRLPGDAEAPRQAVFDKEPCDKCKDFMEQGIILISVDEKLSGDDLQNPYRTGGWVVVKEDFIRRNIGPPDHMEAICRTRVAFVPDDAWDKMKLPREKKTEKP